MIIQWRTGYISRASVELHVHFVFVKLLCSSQVLFVLQLTVHFIGKSASFSELPSQQVDYKQKSINNYHGFVFNFMISYNCSVKTVKSTRIWRLELNRFEILLISKSERGTEFSQIYSMNAVKNLSDFPLQSMIIKC